MRKLILLILALSFAPSGLCQVKPKVRAITAFIRLDRAQYQQQVRDTLSFLRQAKSSFEQRGYEVESVRITTQPFAELVRGMSHDDSLTFLRGYDELAQKESFDTSVGPAMLTDKDDPAVARLLAETIAQSKVLEGSVIIAADDGIHPRSVAAAAQVIKYLEEHSERSQGNFNFSATAMLPALAPFYPGSFHTGGGRQFAVGLESANVVAEVFASSKDFAFAPQELTETLGRFATDIETAAKNISSQTGWAYAGLDLSPAPLKDVSIGQAVENLTHAKFASSGTMSAVAAITAAIKAIPVKQAGYSGLMLPILEDTLLAQRWSEGRVSMDSLLAYSAVCGTGLDTIPLPGDITEQQLTRILSDVASLAFKWHKPLSARLLPVQGKKAGEKTEFNDPFLVNTILQPLP